MFVEQAQKARTIVHDHATSLQNPFLVLPHVACHALTSQKVNCASTSSANLPLILSRAKLLDHVQRHKAHLSIRAPLVANHSHNTIEFKDLRSPERALQHLLFWDIFRVGFCMPPHSTITTIASCKLKLPYMTVSTLRSSILIISISPSLPPRPPLPHCYVRTLYLRVL